MKNYPIQIIFISLIFLLFACRPKDDGCPKDTFTNYPFVESDTNVLIYSIHDTITFESKNFGEITFVCYDKSYRPFIGEIRSSSIECNYVNYYAYAQIEFLFSPYGNFQKFVSYVNKYELSNYPLTYIYLDRKLICRTYAKGTIVIPSDSILYKGKYIFGYYPSGDSSSLFNPDYGILRFEDNYGKVWTLKEKK